MPGKRFVDPVRLRKWLGELQIVELRGAASEPKRFFVRLQGGNVAQYTGVNLHGRYIEDGLPAAVLTPVLRPFLTAMRNACPSYSILRRDLLPGHFESYRRLILPIQAREPGGIVQFIEWTGPTKRVEVSGGSIFQASQFPCEPEIARSELYLVQPDGRLVREA